MKKFLCFVFAFIFIVDSAHAWGPEGHAIIADIAEAHLTDAARSKLQTLLALENHSHLDEVSSWPDAIRFDHPTTGPGHYVDIPLAETKYDANRDCPREACIVVKLAEFTHQLANPTADDQSRLEALKWVVHLVGDIHQPLHAEDNDDKGGNKIELSYFNKPTNFHAVWDSGIIVHALDLHPGPHFTFDHDEVRTAAMELDKGISAWHREQWSAPGMVSSINVLAVDWAEQSHVQAQKAYADLPPSRRPNGWSEQYQEKAWPIAQMQLERAGVRLAEVLNEALK